MNVIHSRLSGACGCVFLLLAVAPDRLCPRSLAAPPDLRQAEELYRQDQLQKAEQAYRRLLPRASGAERQRCYNRLLAIYARVGRQDQAIQIARQYETWARQAGKLQQARELNLALGGWYLGLGHYDEAEKCLRQAIEERAGTTLGPANRVTALTHLALAAEKRGDRRRAARAWREVEEFARGLLDEPRQELKPRQQIDCVRSLADSYRFQGKPAAAIPRLERLLPLHDRLKDPAGRRDTMRLLADHLVAGKSLAEAERRLREAIRLDERLTNSDRLVRADLASALADVLGRQGQSGEAKSWSERAVRGYLAVQATGRGGRIERAGALAAFWKLQALYQRSGQLDLALRLSQTQGDLWRGAFLIEYRLKAEQGGLQVVLGKLKASRPLLRAAILDLEKQSPRNLLELPRAQLNLAVVELVTDRKGDAVKLGRRCVELYRAHHLPDDMILVEAHNLLGTCAAQDGDYAQAIRQFRAGVALCRRLGPAAAAPQSNLLLNTALAYKGQGDLKQALDFCQQAEKVQRAPSESVALPALKMAQASLLAAQGQFAAANRLAGEVLRLCNNKRDDDRPLVVAALHCQAQYLLSCRKFDDATKTWDDVRKLQGTDSPLLPRTLNHLALVQECQLHFSAAERLYRKARDLQKGNPHAFPVTHFTTLWRLANVIDRQGRERRAEARRLLEEALAAVERARARVYGESSQRATFFAQFEPAFDQLVEWNVQDGNTDAALAAASRGRSRTLLDQLLLAAVNPRKGLPPESGAKLLKQEADLRRQIASLRTQARLLSPGALANTAARALLKQFDEVQEEYSKVYLEMLSENPVYRSLAQPEFSAGKLALLRKEVLGPKKLLLVYYVGRQKSYLLLLGGGLQAAEVFPLTVPAAVAKRVACPKPLSLTEVLARTRGFRPASRRLQPKRPPPREETTVPLKQAVLRALVEAYLQQVADPKFDPEAGLWLESRASVPGLPAQRLELLGDILLPAGVRARIDTLAPACLIVVPDGALHKLPFEALVLTAGAQPTYVLDKFPPILYAPSVAILDAITRRPQAPRPGRLSLLTVAAPDYPEMKAPLPDSGDSQQAAVLKLGSKLPRLKYAAKESERIADLVAALGGPVKALRGEEATEKAVVAALPGKHIIHLAVHGFADHRFGNKFGALALMPASSLGTAENDGFWSLHEIYTLRLPDCELAVLSACETNVGPQKPLEGGVTLAGGFLAAGARRVVASHWSVSDPSTADLMAAFFKEVTAVKPGEPVFYAAALQTAQRSVRQQKRWEAPFYWAPFVLVGAAD